MKKPKNVSTGICPESELISAAGRIVQDATDVDWCREPATEYESAIRAQYLATHLRTTFGRSSIMHLAFLYEGRMGSDLQAAADEALRIIAERVAKYEQDALDEARRAVDDRRPQG